jgi:hypothetical protein
MHTATSNGLRVIPHASVFVMSTTRAARSDTPRRARTKFRRFSKSTLARSEGNSRVHLPMWLDDVAATGK